MDKIYLNAIQIPDYQKSMAARQQLDAQLSENSVVQEVRS